MRYRELFYLSFLLCRFPFTVKRDLNNLMICAATRDFFSGTVLTFDQLKKIYMRFREGNF